MLVDFSQPSTLTEVGGKGINLITMARAGLPVPAGFVVSTRAYREHVDACGLGPVIVDAVTGLSSQDDSMRPQALEEASATIAAAFAATTLTSELRGDIVAAWHGLGAPAVAVRSSATAEDLPDLSFAGQQDTYLNITTAEALARAIVDCWASLWTARAIGYRRHVGIGPDEVALAVVVQQLVPADVSGVLFTANALTGHRGETVIDATPGLGEALVSGEVEPDQVVADTATGDVLRRAAGAKAAVTVVRPGGGVETLTRPPDDAPAVSDGDVRRLVELGRRVVALYDAPQDVEWALAGGELFVLQTRAITSLFPLPPAPVGELAAWMSFGAFQGMLAPISPLGRDALRMFLAGAARALGYRYAARDLPFVAEAGERLWIRFDGLLRHRVGRRVVPRLLRFVDPGVAAIAGTLRRDPAFAVRPRRRGVRPVVRTRLGIAATVARVVRSPNGYPAQFDAVLTGIVADQRRREDDAGAEGDPWARLASRVGSLEPRLVDTFTPLLLAFAPIMITGVSSLGVLLATASAIDAHSPEAHARATALEITRALPGNVTTAMDLALWDAAVLIGQDAQARASFAAATPDELAERYLAGTLEPAARHALDGFFAAYGTRGVGEIDIASPRWGEQPAGVLATLQAAVASDTQATSPVVAYQRAQRRAEEAVERLAELAHELPAGRVRARLVRFAARRVRVLLGRRESPKFALVRVLGLVRAGLLHSGADLVQLGVLQRVEDIFMLHADELADLRQHAAEHWQHLVDERRAVQQRDARRTRIPLVLLSDGRTFYSAPASEGADLVGMGVSPGVAEGVVRVVHDPAAAELQPGEVLVCPGTDPAWTPLFLLAAALVTEVGGMMTHGSVVAREYGIPAVVGVSQATTVLRTGQRVRLDGTAGTITLLDAAATPDAPGDLDAREPPALSRPGR